VRNLSIKLYHIYACYMISRYMMLYIAFSIISSFP